MQPLKYDNFMAPMKGSAAISLKYKLNEFKTLYFEKYAKDILVSCVFNKHADRYTFFFKVPSGENDKYPTAIMYDVIIEFNPANNKKDISRPLAELNTYDIYIYSNSPGFVFTFDYVISHKHGFPHCVSRGLLSNIAISKRPEIRNLYEIMTIEKTTWMAFYHLVHNGYLTKDLTKKITNPSHNESFYLKNVESQPAKLKEIKSLQDLMKREKAEAKNKKYEQTYHKDEKESIFSKKFTVDKFNMKDVKTTKNIFVRNNPTRFAKNMFKSFKNK